MIKKEFTKFQIASFKRIAQNVAPLVRRKEKLLADIAKKQEELESIQIQIDAYQGPIKEATGGYTTEDLIVRQVVEAGVDKNGNPIKSTSYKLKYPETVVPYTEEPTTEEPEPRPFDGPFETMSTTTEPFSSTTTCEPVNNNSEIKYL